MQFHTQIYYLTAVIVLYFVGKVSRDLLIPSKREDRELSLVLVDRRMVAFLRPLRFGTRRTAPFLMVLLRRRLLLLLLLLHLRWRLLLPHSPRCAGLP